MQLERSAQADASARLARRWRSRPQPPYQGTVSAPPSAPYDPAGMEQAKPLLPDIAFADSAYACAQGADALIIVTEWEQFRALDLARLKAIMARPVVVDLRNVYRPEDMAKHGFVYQAVGRAFPASAGALEPFPSRVAAE